MEYKPITNGKHSNHEWKQTSCSVEWTGNGKMLLAIKMLKSYCSKEVNKTQPHRVLCKITVANSTGVG